MFLVVNLRQVSLRKNANPTEITRVIYGVLATILLNGSMDDFVAIRLMR